MTQQQCAVTGQSTCRGAQTISAKQAHSMVVSLLTPLTTCCSQRHSVCQLQCIAKRFRATPMSHCSVLLCKGLTVGLCHCTYVNEDLQLTQVCNDPTSAHSKAAKGCMHASLLRAAVRARLTAGLCHCKYTFSNLMFAQVCNDPTTIYCIALQGQCMFLCSSILAQQQQLWVQVMPSDKSLFCTATQNSIACMSS